MLILTAGVDSDLLKVFNWVKDNISIPLIASIMLLNISGLVNNLGNTPLEERFRSNSKKLKDLLVAFSVTLVAFTLLMYLSFGKGNLLGAFVFSLILVIFIFVVSVTIVWFFIERFEFYIELNKVDWKWVRFNEKNGYLIKKLDDKNKDKIWYKFISIDDFEYIICKRKDSRFVVLWKSVLKIKSHWDNKAS